MALLVSLLLICAFIPKALTLRCNACLPGTTCSPNVLTCPYRCSSMTTTVYMGGRRLNNLTAMACADPLVCVSGSVSVGQGRVTLNSHCCTADLCNTQNAPELSRLPLNGRQCFTCNGTDCSKTLGCEGNETQCFSTTVEAHGRKQMLKGCSSKSLCGNNATQALSLTLLAQAPVSVSNSTVYMKCCEGNLCNGAQSSGGFFLLLLLPLLSLVVF